jgi:hypothetical protein
MDEVNEGSEQGHYKEEGSEEVMKSSNGNNSKKTEPNREAAEDSGFSKSAK